ncbi:hypothetical protein MAM1_0074d04268 [Mucor ambiguus]|uniref:Uncharacterized protein n=1 Tax=Mucor ambiguus TaxID=91626 RepID=A0A0C9MS04_9FUNG|nr:hypothetical protein MAM1_0074d04268 [Mucor ambiguus]
MSFKSKQRAKHGHLFGDDPLNATLVAASDDPLFSPTMSSKAQSQSSRTNSPSIANDPLSRPADTSSSTPLSPTRRSATAKSSPSSSIFGDIDVSKLGTSNGKKHTVRSPALRSKQYDVEDEEDLFGGGGHRTRKTSKVTTPTPSVKSPTMHQDIPAVKKTNASPPLTPSVPSSSPSPPVIQQQKPPVVQQRQQIVSKPALEQPVEQPARDEIPATKEGKPTVSSSSSSFFRFFKSSNNNSNTNSKNSSSASSIASVNAPSPIVAKSHDTTNSTTTTTTPVLPPPVPPVRQSVPPTPSPAITQHQQQQPMYRPNGVHQRQAEEPEEEEEEEGDEEPVPIIEDEATRAFAEDDTISFKPSLLSYRSISPELTMDALTIDIPTHTNTSKKLVPSISTPTNNVDDPWSNPLLMQPTIEPSISSPLVVKVQDIEPQKRTAFADLINSWNTGKSNNKEYTNNQDPKEFFDYVAEERRDIGFAGIREHDDDQDDEEDEDHYRRQQQLDYQDEINPWN